MKTQKSKLNDHFHDLNWPFHTKQTNKHGGSNALAHVIKVTWFIGVHLWHTFTLLAPVVWSVFGLLGGKKVFPVIDVVDGSGVPGYKNRMTLFKCARSASFQTRAVALSECGRTNSREEIKSSYRDDGRNNISYTTFVWDAFFDWRDQKSPVISSVTGSRSMS